MELFPEFEKEMQSPVAPLADRMRPEDWEKFAGQEHLVRGYFWSIVFMMSMPFVLLTSFSAYFYYLIRKANSTATNGNPFFEPDGRGSREPSVT